MIKKFYLLLGVTLVLISCNEKKGTDTVTQTTDVTVKKPAATTLTYTLLNTFPHDTTSFTEGLLMHNGELFESSGAPEYLKQTRSMFGTVDLKTGKISVKGELDRNKYFGEGIAVLNNKLYQLTYENQTGFIYDATTFKGIGQFTYKNKEGWGLTTDGTSLIMSDGTSDLTYLDPNNQNVIKTLNVNTINYDLPDQLNELEYIEGFIYANVWRTNIIVKIDPNTGDIIGLLDLTDLVSMARKKYPNSLEMNGIAYDPQTKNIYISGKMWPDIYQLQLTK
jgi:glutamine cyclotransferase